MSLRRDLRPAMLVLALVVSTMGVSVGTAPTAAAALPAECDKYDDETPPVITSVTATNAVVNAGGKTPVTVTIVAADPDGTLSCASEATGYETVTRTGSSGIEGFSITAAAAGTQGGTYEYTSDTTLTSGTIYAGTWQATLWVDKYDVDGSWYVEVSASDFGFGRTRAVNATTFQVRHASGISADAAPEPARKGTTFSVKGKVLGLDPYSGFVRRGSGVLVRIYFKPKGSTTWSYQGADRTDAKGVYARTFKAARDGHWQARFAGDSKFAARNSTADYLDVR